jgi:repressor LexA
MSSTAKRGRTSETPSLHAGSTSMSAKRLKGKQRRELRRSDPVLTTESSCRFAPDHVLTQRQRKMLQVTKAYEQRHGYSPTLREIGVAVGLASPSSVSYQLSILRDKGYLSLVARRPRTAVVRSLEHPSVGLEAEGTPMDMIMRKAVFMPVVGRIAAGEPILAAESIENIFPMPRELVGEGMLFVLKVVGDSMIDAAIADGDWVVVRQQSAAENGEIVAALIDEEATLKTYKKVDHHVWLMPQNPAYSPIPGDEASILGKVVAVLRRV